MIFQIFFKKKVVNSCRSLKMLKNAPFLITIDVDTAENGPVSVRNPVRTESESREREVLHRRAVPELPDLAGELALLLGAPGASSPGAWSTRNLANFYPIFN